MGAAAAKRVTLRDRLFALGGGVTVVPLAILFALNAVDELDRTAFSLLLPEIRDEFGLSYSGVTLLSAAVIPAGLLFALPIARLADRRQRKPIALIGASMWGVFSIFTGFAPTIFLLGIARVGAGLGRAVNGPVHPSLLSDYYPASVRGKVISSHRFANTVGGFVGPLVAGFLATAIGWRLPFVILAVPTFVVIAVALVTLREPERTGLRTTESSPGFRAAFKILWGVRTLRRMWMAFPFIAFVAIGLGPLGSLYYSDVFDVSARGRGIIQAFDSPFILAGLIFGAVVLDRSIERDAGRTIRNIGFAASTIALLIVGAASAPTLWIGVSFFYAIQVFSIVLFVGGITVISLVAPPDARASSFALFEIFSLVGVIALPIVGVAADSVGIRWGMTILTPMLLIGSAIVVSAGKFVNADIARVYPDRVPRTATLLSEADPLGEIDG